MNHLPAFAGLMISILAAVAGFAALVIVHEVGHFLAARLCGMRVERFSVGFGPALWSRKWGATLFSASLFPLGGYVKIAGMAPGELVDVNDRSAYANQPAWRRLVVIAAGPAMSYLVAVALAFAMSTTSGFPRIDPNAVVGSALEGSPAAEAGLRPGDQVVAVAGQPIASWPDLVAAIQAHPGETIEMRVQRGAPSSAPFATQVGLQKVDGRARLGITPHLLLERASPAAALPTAFRRSNQAMGQILASLGQVLAQKQSIELRGPIGIGDEMARSARAGAITYFWMIWFISLMLALMNLLPFPSLDGGRLAFLIYEVVTRRRANQRLESYVHLAGFVTLFGLMLAVTLFGDLARLVRH